MYVWVLIPKKERQFISFNLTPTFHIRLRFWYYCYTHKCNFEPPKSFSQNVLNTLVARLKRLLHHHYRDPIVKDIYIHHHHVWNMFHLFKGKSEIVLDHLFEYDTSNYSGSVAYMKYMKKYFFMSHKETIHNVNKW